MNVQLAVFFLLALIISKVAAKDYGNVRIRLSNKSIQALIFAISNKDKLYRWSSIDPMVETKFGEVTYQLNPDNQTVAVSFELRELRTFDTILHIIEGAKFEVELQIQKSDDSETKLILSRCNFVATQSTNPLEQDYLVGDLQTKLCLWLQTLLSSAQEISHAVSPTLTISANIMESSVIYQDRIDLVVSCVQTVINLRTGQQKTVKQHYQMPDMPEFNANQSSLEIQSADSLNLMRLLLEHFTTIYLRTFIARSSNEPVFVQVESVLRGMENSTHSLTVDYEETNSNISHLSLLLSVRERIYEIHELAAPLVMLDCHTKWQLDIDRLDEESNWLTISDFYQANYTAKIVDIEFKPSNLTNNTATEAICTRLEIAFTKELIIQQLRQHLLPEFENGFRMFLQESATIMKFDVAMLQPVVFESN